VYEEDLKRIVCLHPELVEEGLVVEQEEYPVRTSQTTYRCDLKGRDRKGGLVFIELKLEAGHSVVYQISIKPFSKKVGSLLQLFGLTPR
jgi:RecB family endonuclease NucS